MVLYMATPLNPSVNKSVLMTVNDFHKDSSRQSLECDKKSPVQWTHDSDKASDLSQKTFTDQVNSKSCADNKTCVTKELQNSSSVCMNYHPQYNTKESQKDLLTEKDVLDCTEVKKEQGDESSYRNFELPNTLIQESVSFEADLDRKQSLENDKVNSDNRECDLSHIAVLEKDSNKSAYSKYKKQASTNSKAKKLLIPKLRKFSFKNLIRKSSSIPNLHQVEDKAEDDKKYALDSEFNSRKNKSDDIEKPSFRSRLVKYSSESHLNALCSDSRWCEFSRSQGDYTSYTTFCLIKDACNHSEKQLFNQNKPSLVCDNDSSLFSKDLKSDSDPKILLSNADQSQSKSLGRTIFCKPWKKHTFTTSKEQLMCNSDKKITLLKRSDAFSVKPSCVSSDDRSVLVNNKLNYVHLPRGDVSKQSLQVSSSRLPGSSREELNENKSSGRISRPQTNIKKSSVEISLSRSPDLIKQLTSNCRDRRTSKSSSDLSSTSSDSSYQSSDSCSSSGSRFILKQCRIGSGVAFGLVQIPSSPNGNGYSDGQGLVTIRMKPDDHGRFGFNVKGGADQGMPIIVSRVAPNTPADLAIPRLNEGDQVLFINGRDVSQHTHEQVVMFIRASRETHSGELVLVVRPNVYVGEDPMDEPDFMYIPETHQITSSAGANALEASLILLQESLESGAALAQFDQLYRKKPNMTMNSARQENNVAKNRYRDISPYDQTRVMLKSGEDGDYINGNFVNMEIPQSGILNRYIAAQGPLPNTCTDFWEMIWEQQCSLVVMLTTKVERGRVKCHQYWPELYETADFGKLQITCLKEEETPSFAFREFNLTQVNTNEERHVSHMQYIAWPDHGVPDDPSDFLDFVMKVRHRRSGMGEPTVVHCSAGIGRTGVLITMETAMCLIEANQPVYPLALVRQMRDQRAMLIQTASQYKFVCEAILRVYHDGIVKPLEDFMNQR